MAVRPGNLVLLLTVLIALAPLRVAWTVGPERAEGTWHVHYHEHTHDGVTHTHVHYHRGAEDERRGDGSDHHHDALDHDTDAPTSYWTAPRRGEPDGNGAGETLPAATDVAVRDPAPRRPPKPPPRPTRRATGADLIRTVILRL